jgi:two-component system, chemotaxis family, sensor kinase CheA
MDDFELELKNDFLSEARDLLLKAESSFMSLESDPSNLTLLDAIFRFAHNLKGTSRAVGFGQIAELTHKVEEVLLKLKQGELEISQPVVDALLMFHDKVAEMIDGLKEDISAEFNTHDLLDVLDKIFTVDSTPVTQKADKSNEDLLRDFDQEFEEIETISSDKSSAQAAIKEEVYPRPVTPVEVVKKMTPKKEDETIRVSLQRLQMMSDLVGELIILKSAVESALNERPSEMKVSRALSKICKDIQEMTMALRMVPVSGSFHKLQRIVRDTSKLLGKKVQLKIIGEETEIDRNVLEQLADPLVHLIRNAVDHGIEMPKERLESHKSEEGVVEVMAFHEGSFLVIQITDDGAGIDPEKILKKARDKKIITESQMIPQEEVLNLIFHPGFSTKDEVSEVSGRGVGMDVVKTNIESLGGSIHLQSRPGIGSCFRLVLPLTMAIIDGLLVSVGSQKIIIPRSQVYEICRLDQKDIQVAGGKTPMLRLRSEILPVFSLSSKLGEVCSEEGIALIVRASRRTFAVSIADVICQQQVVVKPSTQEIAAERGIMGTTILGDGRPALIIDLFDLYAHQVVRNQHLSAA